MKVIFRNIENDKIRSCFTRAISAYEILHENQITLSRGLRLPSTMFARPDINWNTLVGKNRSYKILMSAYVNASRKMPLENLPEAVLTGWFAHELGHLVDYQRFSSFQMMGFGLKYLYSGRFKRNVEYEADRIAIRHGFRNEIIASKKFLLENEMIHPRYKARISKYYMPPEMVETLDD